MNNCLGLKRYLALMVALCFTGIYHIGSKMPVLHILITISFGKTAT